MSLVKLEDYVELLSGYAFSSKKFNEEGNGMPIIRIRDVGQEESETYFDGDYDSKYLINQGDLLIAMDGEFRLARWSGRPSLLNQRVCKIRSSSDDLIDEYLYYILPAKLKKIEDATSYVTVKHLSMKKINAIEIPLPSLSEQKSIVAKLDRAQRLIDIDQEMLTKYDELIQSVFLEMFGDPVTNPKGWEKQELGNLISDSRNGLYVKKDNYSEDEGIKMIHMSDAFYGYAKTDESKTVLISEEDVEKYKVDSNDLLIARRSLNIEGAAKPCLIPEGTEDVVFESSLIRITSEAKKLLPIYLYHFLSNERARKEYLNKFITVSTISGINQTNLKKVEVLVPPLDEQEKFKSTVKRIEEEMEELKDYTKKSEELFSSLVQGAFG